MLLSKLGNAFCFIVFLLQIFLEHVSALDIKLLDLLP